MKCEHCGYEAPERAVICPECGEILPRKQQDETAPEKTASQEPATFSMPFLSSSGGEEKTDGITTQDPRERERLAQEKHIRLVRRIVSLCVLAVLILGIVLYQVFLGGYKLAAYRYVKGVDRASGSMYVALVPDAFMDHLENSYETTRRDVKEMMRDYFTSWNNNYGTEGRMSYEILSAKEITDADALSELEQELKTSYGISVEIKTAVKAEIFINDGGTKASENATFVKIGSRWCCMEAMEDIDYVCQYDGYNAW